MANEQQNSLSAYTQRLDQGLDDMNRGVEEVRAGLKGLSDVVLRNEDSVGRLSGEIESLNLRLREFEENRLDSR